MERNATEEEDKHGCPFCGFDDGGDEYFFTETMAKHGEGEWGKYVEYYGHADEDFPGGEVELVKGVVEPADHYVVC